MRDTSPDIERLRQIVLGRLESLERSGMATLPRPADQERWLLDLVTPSSAATPTNSAPPVSRFDLQPVGQRPPEPSPPHPQSPISNPPSTSPMPKRPAASPLPNQQSAISNQQSSSLPQNRAERVAALEVMKCNVAQCTLCPSLVKNRTQTVFGVGNPQPRVAFFGEAPGADEDRLGEPFVGRAGQLLTKIIEACGFMRDDVYILNVLRCRPPDNRPPADDEVANCRGWFEGQLGILRPEYIVCVGATPTKALFPDMVSIGKMRGKIHEWNNTKVVCTYHPSYLLRNPDAKKYVWDDMKMLLADMGLEIPKKP